MKRFNIFSAIGALTIGALALTGCPTTHPDLEYPVLDTSYIYIVTDFGGVEVDEKVYPVGGEVGDNTFHKLPEYEINGSEATTSFKFTNYKGCLWTKDNTGFAFKLSKEPSWGTDIGTSSPAASVGNEIKADGGSDITFTGLKEGGSYIITITARKAGIFVKLESADGTTGGSANDTTTDDSTTPPTTKEVEMNIKKITVNNLPEDATGDVYFTGSFNKWSEPGSDNTVKGTIKDGVLTADCNILIKATVSAGETETADVKFAAAGWTKPEICGEEGGNAKILIVKDATEIVAYYVKTIEDNGKKYVCDWLVK